MNGEGSQQSVITSEVEIKGTIKSSGSVHIDGKLEGDLICEGDASIGKSASIKGTVTAVSVSIEGTINGSINAQDKIAMKSTANIHGDIRAKRLSVDDGVTFIGKSDVNPSRTGNEATPSKALDLGVGDTKSSFLGKGKGSAGA